MNGKKAKMKNGKKKNGKLNPKKKFFNFSLKIEISERLRFIFLKSMKRNILLKIYCRQVDNRVIFHASLVHGTMLVFIYPI